MVIEKLSAQKERTQNYQEDVTKEFEAAIEGNRIARTIFERIAQKQAMLGGFDPEKDCAYGRKPFDTEDCLGILLALYLVGDKIHGVVNSDLTGPTVCGCAQEGMS